MAVRIRLTRTGATHRPFYRIVAADARMPRDGRFIEILGSYNPIESPVIIKIKEARIIDWIQKGAQVSTTVSNLLRKTSTLEKIHLLKNGYKPQIEESLAFEVKDVPKKSKKEIAAEVKAAEAEVKAAESTEAEAPVKEEAAE